MNYSWVVCYCYDCFSVRSLHMLAFSWFFQSNSALRSVLHVVAFTLFHSLKVNFFHSLQFLSVTVTRASRTLTYLIKRLNIPFGVLQKLVNVFAKHLLKVSIINTLLLALITRWLLLAVFFN